MLETGGNDSEQTKKARLQEGTGDGGRCAKCLAEGGGSEMDGQDGKGGAV